MKLLTVLFLSLPFAALGADVSGAPAGQTSVPATTEIPQEFYAEDIKEALMKHITERANQDGVFHIRDERTGELLALKFVTIHDPVRHIDGNVYFACTDFHVVGNENKLYDLDFWMNPRAGILKVYDEKIHKEPRRSLLYGWYKHPRYTFVNDRVMSLY